MRLKLYMAFAPSHVQFDFRSPRSRWGGGGSATAGRWSLLWLNRPHDRRFRVLGPYDPPTSLIQGSPSPQHHHHHQRLLDNEAYRWRGEQNGACVGACNGAAITKKSQRKANLLFLLLFQARHTERLDGPPSHNLTRSSRGGCGGGGRGRKGAFRHPPSCFFVRSSPLPLLSLTKIPVVFPFPSERSIAQAEEDDAPATKGGRASRRTVDDGGGWGTGSARYRGGRFVCAGHDVICDVVPAEMMAKALRKGEGHRGGAKRWRVSFA